MKLQDFRRLFKTDFKQEFQDLVDQLSVSINTGFEAVYDIINNKKLSISDNILCTVKTINVNVSTSGVPNGTTSFALDIPGRIKGISVINAVNLNNTGIFPTSAVFVNFSQNGTTVIINNINGLQANTNYQLTVIAWG